MFKQSLIASALFSLLGASPAYAAQLTGKVVDANNQPLSNATIHLHGKSKSVQSDKNGQFTIAVDTDSQLHISKPNYRDNRINVTEQQGFIRVQLEPTSVETIVVYSSALHKNSMEMTSPVSVLSGDELKNHAKPTLGETLKGQPGINASYFGPVSSSPIIRGLDGPRVKITQNGLDSSDASRVGPDHANTNDSLAAQQIEVLRGPATLLYGSGAIGGVVNVVDNRIPTDVIEHLQGAADYSHDTNSNTNTFAVLLESGFDGFNFHFDGVKRKGGDYETPNFALPHDEHEDHDGHEEHDEHGHEDEHEEHALEYASKVDNTFIDSEQFNLGTSYVGDHLTVGFSYGRVDTDYGIPAHSHIGHDHDHDHEEDAHDHDEEEAHAHEEESVFATVKQDRWQGLVNYAVHSDWLESIGLRVGYTDYEHAEIEDGTVGTVFKNDTTELRLTAEHRLGQWHGTVGYHFSDSDYAADGDEAFTPSTNTKTHALYILEERRFGDFTLELGGRVEDYQLSSKGNQLDAHEDDGDHDHEDEHDHGHGGNLDAGFIAYDLDMTNLSLSIGGVYDYADGHNVAVSLSRSERAPLTAELLSNGIHIATSTYELGLGYELEGDHLHFEPQDIEQETSNNLDISFRKFSGNFGYTVNFFYNDIENFYYQALTDYIFSPEHGLEVADHEHEGAVPVFKFESSDAKLYGLEFDAHYKLSNYSRVKVFGDSLTAKLDNDDYLPRIPSNKLGVDYEHSYENLTANFTVTHYFDQDNIASYESETKGYTLVDMSFNYDFELMGNDMVGYVNLDNLTDELGFVHSSFIKEQAPLPGRNVKLGIRGYF
ncbi:TonB-dependent receptor [Pseudoalteromonas piscicida]|uniref:TonB-dependent receptor n=1 Tax=Pseudoalteromonas piscicida TaxID=43662 RepID=A0A2A5JME1_PSEO7|nr:TonB-dependent receptor [Pseudoalteromonas piscicida]PCK30527.1 TonB-dependent receptor [Pseudoalteromonas piscicida]